MALPEVYDWCEETGEKVRNFGESSYAAETWRTG
jgi:hypothetical protein